MRIGIVGPMGSGKTTVANILAQSHGFRRESLARPVKAIADAMGQFDTVEERARELHRWAMTLLPDPIYMAPNPYSEHGASSRELLVALWLHAYDECESRRELYQMVGTDCGRAINPEIWINYLARHLGDGDVVIDDVRFVNEGEALSDLGFHLLRLDPPDELRAERLIDRDGKVDESRMSHPSEVEQSKIACDRVWTNSVPLDILSRQVGALVGQMRLAA